MEIEELKSQYDKLLKDEDFDKLDLGLKNPNIFQILRITKNEIRHSNFLSWLLDPYESHKLGDIFLKRFLREVFSSDKFLEIDQVDVEGMDLSKVEIENNWNSLIYDKYIRQVKIDENMLRDKIRQIKKSKNKSSYLLSEIIFEIKKDKSLEDSIVEINNSIKEIGFKNTANLFSISDSSKFGGNIGWIDESSFSKEIYKEIKILKTEEITNPIKLSNNNFILLKLNDIKKNSVKIDEKKEFQKLKSLEQNKKLNNFSKIYFDKIKIDMNISEL